MAEFWKPKRTPAVSRLEPRLFIAGLFGPELNQQQYVLIGSSGFDSKIGFLLL